MSDSEMKKDVIEGSIGAKGKFQYILCFAIAPIKVCLGTIMMSFVFMAPPPDFHCSEKSISKCSLECPSHTFNKSVFTETIITEWDLVCDNSQMANVAQTTFMFGLFVGSVFYGYLADKYGRLKIMVLACVIQGLSGVGAAFSPWYWLFIFLRFICASATSGNITTSFTYIMEISGTKWRVLLGTVMQIPINIGLSTTALWSYFFRDWRDFQLAISIPTLLIACYVWILPESPRWLVATGQTDKAVGILEKAAIMNNLPTKNIQEEVDAKVKESKKTNSGSTFDLVRTPYMRKTTACIFANWLICGLCFYGEAQFMGQIGNVFMNIAIPNLIQIPSDFTGVIFMEKFGRKFAVILYYLISSACLLAIALLPPSDVLTISILSGIGYITASISFSIMFIFTGELYPTVVRNLGSGYASMFSRIGSMSAPFIASLSTDTFWLSPLIFGICPLIGACLCLLLPETKDCKLPDTIEEAEIFGNEKNNFKFIPKMKEVCIDCK